MAAADGASGTMQKHHGLITTRGTAGQASCPRPSSSTELLGRHPPGWPEVPNSTSGAAKGGRPVGSPEAAMAFSPRSNYIWR
jgi:hypothetical protein